MESSSFAAKFITLLSGLSGVTAYGAILGVLLICGLGVPLPEDITLISAGILAAIGSISLAGALVAGFVGVLFGDAILFNLGRKYGRHVFKLPLFRRIFTEARIAAAEKKILHNSKFICFTARFLPGLRAPIYLTAGVMGVKPMHFYLLDGFAALISVPVWVVGGWWFGQRIEEALGFAKQAQIYLVLGIGVVITIWLLIKWRTKKKRLISSQTPSQ